MRPGNGISHGEVSVAVLTPFRSHGTYQTAYGSCRGMVEDRGWGDLRFYMFEPPHAVRRSNHWACFTPRGKKGFHVHMGRRPADVSSGILTIERLLTESFQTNGRQ